MARIIKPPASLIINRGEKSVFLAGSIEMGSAEDWQATVTSSLQNLPILILNPRRDAWDSSWKQSITNPQFREQVEWELNALDAATCIAMYFDPSTKAPITLLELGLYAGSGKLRVCCPDGYWRKGNVEVVCNRFNVPLFASLEQLIDGIHKSVMKD